MEAALANYAFLCTSLAPLVGEPGKNLAAFRSSLAHALLHRESTTSWQFICTSWPVQHRSTFCQTSPRSSIQSPSLCFWTGSYCKVWVLPVVIYKFSSSILPLEVVMVSFSVLCQVYHSLCFLIKLLMHISTWLLWAEVDAVWKNALLVWLVLDNQFQILRVLRILL